MSGLSGKIILHVMPHVPLLSRLFNPSDWRFAAFEAFFYEPGHEKALQVLFESVLSVLNVHAALIWMDEESPLHAGVLANMQLGMLNKIKSDVPVQIISFAADNTPGISDVLKKQPAYVSAFDLS